MNSPATDVSMNQHLFSRIVSWQVATGLGLLLVILAGLLDWFTGPEIGSSVIYLIPISLVAWGAGRWLGLGMACLCGVMWSGIELATNENYTHALIPYWNGLVRLTIFCFVALLVSEVAKRKRVERALRQAGEELEARAHKLAESEATLARQRGILQSVLDSMAEGVVVVDDSQKIVLSNPAAKLVLVTVFRDADAATERLASVLSDNPTGSVELTLPRLDTADELCLMVNARPLSSSNQEINGGVIVFNDITSLRKLERQIAEVSDREQRRLGQDLHDGLCQQLVSIAFAARTLADKLRVDARSEATEAERMAESLNDAITQARDVARGLYLVQLEVGGLSSALEELAARIQSRHRLNCKFVDHVTVPITETFGATDLFRIAQEAIGNALKHARATNISIVLEADANRIVLQVQDNGIGITKPLPNARGMGLHIMQYRARMIGAVCAIDGGPQAGTVVTCSLPRRNTEASTVYGQRD